jgi:hypothetical protein
LKGADFSKLKKCAGEEFAYRVSMLPPPDGEEYVHVIALGCLEAYGPNRKGDAFPEEVCRKYHSTFRKYARWYREHIHHDPSKSYGVVKLSSYNEKMRRIDLVVALNATEEACEKNGGLIADKELERLYSGDPIHVSMACRVSYDICSGCGNKARSRAEYCTSRTCIKYGGCKQNLGRAFEDGHILHVINPDPLFFDISYVQIPADRTAISLGILKEGISPIQILEMDDEQLLRLYKNPEELRQRPVKKQSSCQDIYVNTKLNLLKKLAHFESNISTNEYWQGILRNFNLPIRFDLKPIEIIKLANSHDCILPPAAFVANVLSYDPSFKGIRNFDTSRVFFLLQNDKNLIEKLASNKYFVPPEKFSEAFEFSEIWSLDENKLAKTASNLIFKNKITKSASQLPMAFSIDAAKEYGLYLIDALMAVGFDDRKLKHLVKLNKSWN